MTPEPLRPGETAVMASPRCDAALAFVGRIRTPWRSRADCPRQGDRAAGPLCRIELDPLWAAALDGLKPGDLVQVLYWMHLARRDLAHQRPHGRATAVGTFAIRSPVRPNPIAVSVARLEAVDGITLVVRGLDCVDGTPLLDLKPERRPEAPGV